MFSIFKTILKKKPTAEETFKCLQGYTYEEVTEALVKEFNKQDKYLTFNFYRIVNSDSDNNVVERRNKVFEKHYWTHSTYLDEMRKRILNKAV